MSDETLAQAPMTDAIGRAIQALIDQELVPAAIHLTFADYEAYQAEETSYWREKLGLTAVYPTAFEDGTPLISEKLADRLQLPVCRTTGLTRRSSMVYATTGQCVKIGLL
jgi:hypothetical protein